jgi:predicted DNA-binding transcriptional regulator AlpA
MPTRAKTASLLTHRTVAKRLDIDTETLREWVAAGEFPRPRAIVRKTWLYPRDWIEHYIDTGGWPEGAEFRGCPPPPPRS